MHKAIARVSLALPFLVLVGCAAPKSVSLDPTLDAARLSKPALACPFEFDGISVEFDQLHVQGYWHNGTEMQNLAGYVDGHIRSWLPDTPMPGQATKLEVALHRLTSESKSTASFFNVVLRVNADNAAPEYLRGRHSSITWFGTAAEFQINMQRAINEALIQLHANLERRCREAAVA